MCLGGFRWKHRVGGVSRGLLKSFIRELATDFQDDGRFWPSSILGGVDLTTVEQRRKRVYPETIVPEKGSTPAWFWWGFGCDNRYGLPLETLQTDIKQFKTVMPGLEARWRRDAPRRKRAQRKLAGKPGELAETAAGEAAGAALAALNVVVPGLGFVALAAKWTYQGVKDRRADEELVNKPADLAEETAVGVATFAREALPVVIFVEDLHNADEQLVELLRRLLVTTMPECWLLQRRGQARCSKPIGLRTLCCTGSQQTVGFVGPLATQTTPILS